MQHGGKDEERTIEQYSDGGGGGGERACVGSKVKGDTGEVAAAAAAVRGVGCCRQTEHIKKKLSPTSCSCSSMMILSSLSLSSCFFLLILSLQYSM